MNILFLSKQNCETAIKSFTYRAFVDFNDIIAHIFFKILEDFRDS